MSEWEEVVLKDIAIINPTEQLAKGKVAKKIPMEILKPFIKRIDSFITEPYNGGVKFRNGDTIVARITPSLENGKTAYVDILDENEVGFGSTEFIVLREKHGVSDNNFLYYFATSKIFRDVAILSMTGSSGRQRVQTEVVKNFIFYIPPLPEQKAIAGVLSSLDDKIDLLHRQNKTLEAMAETLFRQWFIEEAEDDWEETTLGDVINLFDNQRVPLSKMERNKKKIGQLYPYYGAATIMDHINDYIFDGDYILLAEDGSVRTNEGYPILQYATGKFWVNNHAHVLTAKEPYNNFFLWIFLKNTNIDTLITGAVQPKINQTNLNSLPFPIFPIKKVKEFRNQTDNIFSKININKMQINVLKSIRDQLHPKLMSGEVRVEYQE